MDLMMEAFEDVNVKEITLNMQEYMASYNVHVSKNRYDARD
jgi:hypothetical protein